VITTQRFLTLALICLAPSLATADDAGDAAQNVLEVNVRGNEVMSADTVLAQVKTRPPNRFDEQVAQDDVRRLMATGRFDNVVVVKAPTDRGYVVTFIVKERKFITAIELRGNKELSDKKLHREIGFGTDDPLDYGRAAMGRLALEDLYRKEGFYFANVKLDAKQLKENRRVVYVIVEGPRIRVDKIDFEFEGDRSYSNRKLRGQIKTRRRIWILSRGRLDPQQLGRDVAALQTFYRDRGYLDVQIAKDLTFSTDKTKAYVKFIINEGPRYRVAEIRTEGNSVFAAEELTGRLVMVPGRYFNALEHQRDTQTLKDVYGEIGYLDAAIEPQMVFRAPDAPPPAGLEVDEDQPSAWLIMVYRINEGRRFRLGRITIRGNTITKDRVIRRQLTMFPGQWFNTAAMRKSTRTLQESLLFTDAEITPYGDQPGVRNALVTVADGRTTQVIFGAGYNTNTGLLGNIHFAQRNFSWTQWPTSWYDLIYGRGFKGDGQTLQFKVEPGSEMLRARVDWTEPYLFDRPINLNIGAYTFSRERESYDEAATGAMVSIGKLFKNRWYGGVTVQPQGLRLGNLEDDAPSEVRADRGDSFLLSFGGNLVRDLTDSRWQPSTGSRISLGAEQNVGDYSFLRLSVGGTRYWTVYVDALDRKHVIAARARGGFLFGNAPVFERFYGGGIGNIRGFDFRGISPRTRDPGSDDPIGGDFMAYLGSEYVFPMVGETLLGAVFVDSGTVEASTTVTTWRVSAGVGLRVVIPQMGVPMSLNFGFPLSKSDEDDREVFSFTVGMIF